MLFQALYDAALHYRKYRLPELMCGIGRQLSGEPVHYPVSCSPQAWASGAPFLLLTGLLGLRPRAQAGELVIDHPHLPPFVQRLRIDDLRIGSRPGCRSSLCAAARRRAGMWWTCRAKVCGLWAVRPALDDGRTGLSDGYAATVEASLLARWEICERRASACFSSSNVA